MGCKESDRDRRKLKAKGKTEIRMEKQENERRNSQAYHSMPLLSKISGIPVIKFDKSEVKYENYFNIRFAFKYF